MKYDNFQLEDFLKDESFVQWVKNPTEDAVLFWESWLSEHPHKKETVTIAKSVILSVRYKDNFAPAAGDMAQVWENILSAEKSERQRSGPFRFIGTGRVLRYAAIFVFATLAALIAWKYRPSAETISSEVAAIQHIVKPAQISTQKGERLAVTLPDGSRVILNAESALSYGSDFGSAFRDVALTGEAFFDVAHNKAKPFRIVTGKLTTTVVGTSFNISAYPEQAQIGVAVLTGKVKVAAPEKGEEGALSLAPNEMSVFTKKTGALVTSQFDAENVFGWKDNQITWKNADYPEIKRTLERWFGVSFVVEKGLVVKEEFSAKFKNATLSKVLDALNYTSRFQYKLVKDTIYVTRKNET